MRLKAILEREVEREPKENVRLNCVHTSNHDEVAQSSTINWTMKDLNAQSVDGGGAEGEINGISISLRDSFCGTIAFNAKG
jgi:hypothetical protein